jgi:hypothetical protein
MDIKKTNQSAFISASCERAFLANAVTLCRIESEVMSALPYEWKNAAHD